MRAVTHLILTVVLITICECGYVLYEITAFNPHERAFLYSMQIKIPSIIFLNGVSNEAAVPMDVVVRQGIAHMFERSLQSVDIQYQHVTNISTEQLLKQQKQQPVKNISNTFYNWQDIQNWLARAQSNHAILKKVVIGKTYEKRDIFFLRIRSKRENPNVFIVGGEDGMDWMSSAVILNLVKDLLYDINELQMLSKNFTFYFVPILNPDGFVYSKTKDRLWSKNRRKMYSHTKCDSEFEPVGVNIARNWLLQKASKMVGEECNAVYVGQRPLSEEENQSLSYVLNNIAVNMIAFINVRGFGKYITIPYALTSQDTNNRDIVMEILKATCTAVKKKHNATFYLGITSEYFYNFTGNMADWVKQKLNIPLVYTIYLEDVETVLPLQKDIKAISEQFYSILNESLVITKLIYGPLFDNQIKMEINLLLFHIITFLQLSTMYF